MNSRPVSAPLIFAALSLVGVSEAQVRLTHTNSVQVYDDVGLIGQFTTNIRVPHTTSAPSFVCGDTFTIHQARLTSIFDANNNLPGDFRFVARCDELPGVWIASATNIFANQLNPPVTNFTSQVSAVGPLIGLTIPANASWTVEYGLAFDPIPSSPNQALTLDRLDFTIRSGSVLPTVTSPVTLSFPGTMSAVENAGSGVNSVITTSNSTTSALLFNGTVYLRNPSQIGNASTNSYFVLAHSSFPLNPIVFRSESPDALYQYLAYTVQYPKLTAATSSLANTMIPPGGTWTLESAWASSVGSTSHSNITLGLQGTTFTVGHTGTLINAPVNDLVRDPDNAVINLGSVTAAMTLSPRVLVGEGFMSRSAPSATATQARVRLRNSAYPCAFLDFQPSTTSFNLDGIVSLPVRTQTIAGYGNSAGLLTTQTMVGYSIPAGSVWTAEPYTTTDTLADQQDSEIDYLKFYLLNEGTAIANTSFTRSSQALGTWHSGIGNLTTPAAFNLGSLSTGVAYWMRFDLTNGLSDKRYLDIWTDRTSTTSTGNPALALYNSNGMLIAHDADDDNDLFPALTFGKRTAPRSGNGNGLAFDGRDAECLEPGTYYLAWWPSLSVYTVANGYSITGIAGGGTGLGGRLMMRTDIPPPAINLSGVVALNGLSDDATIATDQLFVEAYSSGGTLVASGTSSITPTGNYSINLSLPGAGTYTFRTWTRTSLVRTVTRSVTTLPITQSWNLINGNADRNMNDNEIGPGDLQIVLDNFGIGAFETRSDLDKDGECGPGDLQIVLDGFGLEGD